MNRYDPTDELSRLRARPTQEPIKLMGLLIVAPACNSAEYTARLRSLLSEAIEISREADFDEEDVAPDCLPSWFLALTNGHPEGVDDDPVGSEGKSRYLAARDNRPWEAVEWIYTFDPELRSWSWWDATEDDHGNVRIWIDTKGEPRVPMEELWWAVYLAGARNVEPMSLEYAEVWRRQASLPADT
ncbi:hypothetical protein OIU91_23335 [Streptomyces sp. NBC_01456]|uniref:hypothetical protein n=1 Tax=unclassified Streptomyces TaxID=2593676 RepID=UPI002E32DFD1|nr:MULTISPECIES: hypothetical protein [unclassified Streptomyces]